MLSHGADSFWYWDVGAFVFAGDKTAVSVSGREYKTDNHIIEPNDTAHKEQKECGWISKKSLYSSSVFLSP